MRKLFLHVGFAKCGSTSLQKALMTAPNVVFPKSGNHGGEHLAFALTIRGLDDWTKKFFDEEWVKNGQNGMLGEISASSETVVLSSERLTAVSDAEIEKMVKMFVDFDVEVIVVEREIGRFLSSTWRHAVYRHDFADSYEIFKERFKNFAFENVANKFNKFFPVHVFDMEAPDHAQSLGNLIGTTLEFPRANIGVPFELAALLQKTHKVLGSEEFKKRFDAQTKKRMLDNWNEDQMAEIEPMSAPLF